MDGVGKQSVLAMKSMLITCSGDNKANTKTNNGVTGRGGGRREIEVDDEEQ